MRESHPPSGDASPEMWHLDRVWRAAWLHGFRVGYQTGKHGYIVLTCRDVMKQLKVIAIIGRDLDDASDQLLERMLSDQYIPQSGSEFVS